MISSLALFLRLIPKRLIDPYSVTTQCTCARVVTTPAPGFKTGTIRGTPFPVLLVTKDKLYIFYNDIEKNLAYNINSADEEPKRFNSMDDMYLMMVEVDSQGKMSRKQFVSTEKSGHPFYIGGSKQTAPNHFIIYCYRFKKEINRLGLAVFE